MNPFKQGVGPSISVDLFQLAFQNNQIGEQTMAALQRSGLAPVTEKITQLRQDELVKWLKVAACKGSGFAQERLGYFYYHGLHVKRSKRKAIYWLRKAAEQGVDMAVWMLWQIDV
jgi:TPR repeat protein